MSDDLRAALHHIDALIGTSYHGPGCPAWKAKRPGACNCGRDSALFAAAEFSARALSSAPALPPEAPPRCWDCQRALKTYEREAPALPVAPEGEPVEGDEALPPNVRSTMVEVIKRSIYLGSDTGEAPEMRQAASVDAHVAAILRALRAAKGPSHG